MPGFLRLQAFRLGSRPLRSNQRSSLCEHVAQWQPTAAGGGGVGGGGLRVSACAGRCQLHAGHSAAAAAAAAVHSSSSSSSTINSSSLSCRPAAAPARRQRPSTCTAAAATATAAAAGAAATGASPATAAFAVFVGWLVIAGSCIRSLPQILRILRNKSVRGLSLTSFSSELFCYLVSVAYNWRNAYAWSTYGDTAICAVQNAAIIGLIFWLDDVPRRTALALSAGLAAAGWWLFGACPPAALVALQTGSVVLLALGGRLPQILLNLRRGNSGELSLATCALSFVGNLMRVFTSATLVGDPLILGSAAVQATLNGILVWQCVDTLLQARRGSAQQAAAPPAAPPAAA